MITSRSFESGVNPPWSAATPDASQSSINYWYDRLHLLCHTRVPKNSLWDAISPSAPLTYACFRLSSLGTRDEGLMPPTPRSRP